ncbi:MAG: glycosyltransferase [Thermomicrobiales bacterium]
MIDTPTAGSAPLISCLCLTYRRPGRDQYLLEEAIESFLRQSWPNRELIVLNDCPGQVLACDAPGVRVYNHPHRFNSVGEKRNLTIALARGDLLAPWDDDDISLPWRLELSVERLGDADYYSPGVLWVMRDGWLQPHPTWYFAHIASLFTRRGFQTVGGYRALSFGEDLRMDEDLRTLARRNQYSDPHWRELPDTDLYYLYRAGASPNHLSRAHNPFRWDEIGSRPVDPGHFTLRPHWRTDYVALAQRQALRRVGVRPGAPPRDDLALLVGNLPPAEAQPPDLRAFPLPEREPTESPRDHLRRVRQALESARMLEATHLWIPPQHASWLERSPLVLKWLTSRGAFLPDFSRHGLLFALTP